MDVFFWDTPGIRIHVTKEYCVPVMIQYGFLEICLNLMSRVSCLDPLQELKDVAENLRKNFVNKFGLVTTDSRARAGISSGAAGLDFVFVVDSSASVGRKNFKRGIEFIKTIIDEYGVSSKPQGTRVAIVTFSSQATVRFNLKTKVMKDKHQAMKELGKKLENVYTTFNNTMQVESLPVVNL